MKASDCIFHFLVSVLMSVDASNLAASEPNKPTTPAARRAVEPADLVRQPSPGNAIPGSFAFSADSQSFNFLKSESSTLNRVYWTSGVAPVEPKVAARAPGAGDTEANLSLAEKLRRERQRARDTGISQVIRAKKADVVLIPLKGDLHLLGGEGLERLTSSKSPAIDPQLTDDGSKVAFVRDDELFVLNLKSRAETQLTHGAVAGVSHGLAEFAAQEELGRSTGFWWAPDGSKLAYQETDERHIPLFTIVHEGGDTVGSETHRYPFAGKENARVRLGIVSASGGETTWLNLPGLARGDYLARIDWESPTSFLLQLLSRDQTRLSLLRVDAATGENRLLFEETSPTWINLHDDLRIDKKTGGFLWSNEKTGYRHLEWRDRDGALVRTLTSGDWPVDRVVHLDSERREVWFLAGRETPLESQLHRVSLDGGEITKITGEPGIHAVQVAPDGSKFVDQVSSRIIPTRTTLKDRSGNVLGLIDDARSDTRIGQIDLIPPEFLTFKNRDGLTLYGAYYPPTNRNADEKVPLVVMVYGGPHVQTVSESWSLTSDLTAQLLARHGFAVWKMDNRGSSRRGHEFEAALNRRMGTVEVLDQVDGVRFITANKPELDASRVGITGRSYGGYMTIRCLTEAADVFKAGLAGAPVTDWDGYDTAYTERYMGTPENNAKGYRESSCLPTVGKLRGKLLVIHGMMDENVHFRHSARLANALIAEAKPFELLPLPESRHSVRRDADILYYAERLVAFFVRSLKVATSN